MDINLESGIMKPPVMFTSHMITKPKEEKKKTNSNKVYQHLSDHNYINSIKANPNLTTKQLKKQLIITDLKAIYNCTTCGYRSMSRNALFKHICMKKPKLMQDTMKKIPKGYEKCLKCNFSTTSKINLITHMKSHIEGEDSHKFQNKQCTDKQCTDCNLIKTNSDAIFKCPNCNFSVKNLTSLKIHMHIHSRGSPYKCTECNFSGKDLKELIRHYDDAKDLRCHCGYVTHMKRQMASHVRHHTQEKPFCCGVCGFTTTDRAVLHRHMRNKHIIN